MLKIFSVLTAALLLCACAAQWRHADNGYALRFQRADTAGEHGTRYISPDALQASDILFSADSHLTSRGLRLFGASSVSHTFLYLGDGMIAEAVGSGVRLIPLSQSISESTLLAAYRHPLLTDIQAARLREFAQSLNGSRYNHLGILKQAPYTLTRKACELPLIPRPIRHLCLNTLAIVQITPFSGDTYFCSQFVIAAFNHAKQPLTDTPPEWIAPADVLHMRAGDIPSVKPKVPLQYVGHLRCENGWLNHSCDKTNQSPELNGQ